MTTQSEAMKLALEALEVVTKELLAVRDELAERGGRPKTNVFHQRLWDSSHTVYTDKAIPAAIALREALAEQPAQLGREYRCCPHDSDCSVHNEPAYPAAPCDCTYKNTHNLPPSAVVHEICLTLLEREVERREDDNFGRYPNDPWSNKVVSVYHFFNDNPKAKNLTVIYTTPQAQPAREPLTDDELSDLWYKQSLDWMEFARAIEAAHGITKGNT